MNQPSLDVGSYPKPLPQLTRDEKLPPLPPPPSPPPKVISESTNPTNSLSPPQITTESSLDLGLEVPLTPTTSASPTTSNPSSLSGDGKPKKSNPLIDLIDTEKLYVDQMTGIIRKVASAWSRSNLPPPELDSIFRSIESVYKANRSLLSKLKEIGTNPSSPKALGDLLMRWIDDLEGPYTSYCDRYCAGFDVWEPVQSNARLPTVLANFSASNPPPTSALSTGSPDVPMWTLDALFLLPKGRLKYYKKLYNRLLRSTAPGRSDYRLLVGALDKLDKLLSALESRGDIKVGAPAPVAETEDEVVIDMKRSMDHKAGRAESSRTSDIDVGPGNGNETSSTGESNFSRERFSRETVSTSMSRGSTATLSMPISDLERRLATDHTLDIFTMKPKTVRLQMAPPSLTFTRELRFSIDVTISLTPNSTGVEVIHQLGHVFLLSDLFLVCERMTPEERASRGQDGPDMRLCYPPLAGKVLRVSEVSGQENALQVAIMRKETLIIQTESTQVRNFMMAEFKECMEFSSTVSSSSKQQPPPLPPLHTLPRSVPPSLPSQHAPPSDPPRRSMTPPSQRSFSPADTNELQHTSWHHENVISQPTHSSANIVSDTDMSIKMPNLVLSPEAQMQQGAQRVPSLHDPLPGPLYTRTSSSSQAFSNPMGPGSEPVHPPMRSTSFRPIPSQNSSTRPGQVLTAGQSALLSFHQHPIPGPNTSLPSFQQPPHRHYGAPLGGPPSDPTFQSGLRNSPSSRSLGSQFELPEQHRAPPLPSFPGGYPPPNIHDTLPRNNSYGSLSGTLLPSVNSRSVSMAEPSFQDPSPPNSPIEETRPAGPVTSTISAQMKCKVFLKQQHAQWKALGAAKLKLYRQDPTNIKQLVVEADNKAKSVLISTIVLTDGVERVGKTGVAVELSDKGVRTGIIYMIQLRNETSAGGLFDSLLAGSDRAGRG